MLLAVDIGNTTITTALCKGRSVRIMDSFDVGISQVRLRSVLIASLKKIKSKYSYIEAVVLCSVVPEVLDIVEREIVMNLKVKPKVIGRDIRVPIKNNYRNPKQVGQDRLVCAYAAKYLYGQPAIIIDLGTAITFDVVSRNGSYEGGLIVPGIRLSVESLYTNTALLPKISSIKRPHTLIGKDTKDSILSGIFNGYGAMCRGLIDSISKQIGGRPKVIVTGGHTELMIKYIAKKITKIDNNLVFKGINMLDK